MAPGAIDSFGAIGKELSNLVLFSATISLVIWGVVAVTLLVRFVARLRYQRRKLRREEELEDL